MDDQNPETPDVKNRRWSGVLLVVATVAAAYYLTAELSLTVVNFHSTITAIWLPSGVALGSVMVFGLPALIGVALGSLSVNLFVQDFFSVGGVFGVAGVVGGVVLQAVVARALIRRFVDRPIYFMGLGNTVLFLAFAGPIGSLINPTFGAAAHYFAGSVVLENFPYSWVNWWIGDTVGGLIVAPLIMTWFPPSKSALNDRRVPTAVALIATAAMIGVLLVSARWSDEAQIKATFDRQVNSIYQEIRAKVHGVITGNQILLGFFAASDEVTRDDFSAFGGRLVDLTLGLEALAWVRVVPDAQRAHYEAALAAEMGQFFAITEHDSIGRLTRASRRDEYAVVHYVAPMHGNEPAVGYDLGANQDSLLALKTATKMRQAAAAKGARLIPTAGNHRDVLVALPYLGTTGMAPDSMGELKQFAVAVLRVERLVGDILLRSGPEYFHLTVTDRTLPTNEVQLFSSALNAKEAEFGALHPEMTSVHRLDVAGRDWEIVIAPTATFFAAQVNSSNWAVLGAVLALSALAVVMILNASGRHEEFERLVNTRTAELRQSNSDLVGAKAEAVRASRIARTANQAKSDFLAHMNYEFRTPLNTVIAYSDILRYETFGPIGGRQNKEYLEDINRSGRHLLALVSDILDVSKIEAGAMITIDQEVDVSDLIDECLQMDRVRSGATGLVVIKDIGDDLPLLRADIVRLKQILLNLIFNALKFTPEGGRVVVAARLGADNRFLFSVSDTGPGIAKDKIELVFQPFAQIRDSLNVSHSGTGVGLSLVKSFTEMHGGTITLDSQLGQGTTVTVEFPPNRTVLRSKETLN